MENFKNLPPLESDTELVAKPNVFADIIAGRAPVSEVYRDDLVMVFMDIQPINPGHTLVLSLQPARFLDELNDSDLPARERLDEDAAKLRAALAESFAPKV